MNMGMPQPMQPMTPQQQSTMMQQQPGAQQ